LFRFRWRITFLCFVCFRRRWSRYVIFNVIKEHIAMVVFAPIV